MVRPIVDSRGNVISSEQVSERTNIIGARNYRGGLPDADANLSFIPTDRRGIAGLQGKFQEMLTTHVGIASAAYWAITEGAALPKEIVWPHRQEPDADADAFIAICQAAVIDEAVVFDGMLEGANALWSYPLLDAFIGFGLMLPRMMSGGSVEWYPISHNAVMLWKPNGYLLGGVRFSTPNGYDDIDAADLVHVVHGMAGAGEFEGRSILRDLVQPFELWKQIAINAGIYNQLSWGFLDIQYAKNVSDDDISAFNVFAQQFQDGQRKYILRPESVNVEMRYPTGTPPDVIAQLEYWDRQIDKKLNAPLGGISQFGSRAMAETLDDAAGRKAKSWLNSIFERQSRAMFQWLAQAVGYEGRLPRLQIQAAEMTTGIGGWNAYVAGVQAGLLTKGPEDESWGRRVIGAPELEAAPVVAEDSPAPLLVGSLQVAQTVLQSLKVSPLNPVPIAPEAAVLLLIAAGLNEAAARNMVAAQMTVPDASAPVAETPPVAAATPEPTPATAPPATDTVGVPAPPSQPQTVIGGNIEVPAAIGESSAFAPAKSALSDIDLTPTAEMAANAETGLTWRDEYGRGGTAVGVARARDLKNRRPLSEDVVRRMSSYFARHAVDKDAAGFNKGEDGFPSAGRVAWMLWGGDAGADWSARKVAELNRSADMADAVDRMSKTTTAAFVPSDVRVAAEAALAAHASSTRRRTTDADALVTAQRLASGEPLEMARIARLVSYFNAADAAERKTARYAMRGGAVAEAWTARLVAAWSRNASTDSGARARSPRPSCDCGACNDLADDDDGAADVIVIGGDGKPFAAWRELRPEESVVGFATLAENRVDADAALAAEIEAIAVRHREAVKRALRDGWQAGERDAVWLKFVEEYQTVLSNAAGRLRNMTDAEVIQEMQRAMRGGNIGGGVTAEQAAAATKVLAEQATDAFARAAALTQKAGEVIADRVQGEVENAILGGADMALFASRITPAGLVRSAAESRNVVEQASRVATYAKAPEAVGLVPTQVIRSSIPDGARCEVCAAADTGEKLDVADYVVGGSLQLPPLPDPNCLGGVGRCRCGYFAIFKR